LGIILLSAAVFRWPGAWLGVRISRVTRHALGWFTAVMGAGTAVLLLNFIERPGFFLDDLRGGLAASAILGGLFVASMVEVVIGSIELLWLDWHRHSASHLGARDRILED